MSWIKINDKMVKKGECVDVYVSLGEHEGRLCNCFYNPKNNKFWYWDEECKNKIQIYASYVTHWMPLPCPPED